MQNLGVCQFMIASDGSTPLPTGPVVHLVVEARQMSCQYPDPTYGDARGRRRCGSRRAAVVLGHPAAGGGLARPGRGVHVRAGESDRLRPVPVHVAGDRSRRRRDHHRRRGPSTTAAPTSAAGDPHVHDARPAHDHASRRRQHRRGHREQSGRRGGSRRRCRSTCRCPTSQSTSSRPARPSRARVTVRAGDDGTRPLLGRRVRRWPAPGRTRRRGHDRRSADPGVPADLSLDPGESRTFDVVLHATRPARSRCRPPRTATDAAGSARRPGHRHARRGVVGARGDPAHRRDRFRHRRRRADDQQPGHRPRSRALRTRRRHRRTSRVRPRRVAAVQVMLVAGPALRCRAARPERARRRSPFTFRAEGPGDVAVIADVSGHERWRGGLRRTTRASSGSRHGR